MSEFTRVLGFRVAVSGFKGLGRVRFRVRIRGRVPKRSLIFL